MDTLDLFNKFWHSDANEVVRRRVIILELTKLADVESEALSTLESLANNWLIPALLAFDTLVNNLVLAFQIPLIYLANIFKHLRLILRLKKLLFEKRDEFLNLLLQKLLEVAPSFVSDIA